MGVDLNSESGDSTSFGYGGWSMLLDLAQHYGWKPLGTEPPEDLAAEDWDRDYDSSDGQLVTAADAASLAAALERAAADPQLHTVVMGMDETNRETIVEQVGPELAASYVGVDDFEEYRDSLLEFAAFCQEGAFRIE